MLNKVSMYWCEDLAWIGSNKQKNKVMGWSLISWFQSSLLERWRLNVKLKSDLIGSKHKNVLHFE